MGLHFSDPVYCCICRFSADTIAVSYTHLDVYKRQVQETGHPAYRADDALWLFPTVYKYIAESGNLAFIDEVIPFANKDEATVYELSLIHI